MINYQPVFLGHRTYLGKVCQLIVLLVSILMHSLLFAETRRVSKFSTTSSTYVRPSLLNQKPLLKQERPTTGTGSQDDVSKHSKKGHKNKKKQTNTKPSTSKRSPSQKRSAFSLEKLPLRFDHWIVDIRPKVGSTDQCVLRSNDSEIKDGKSSSIISLEVHESVIKLVTTSEIDITYPGTGVYLGNSLFTADTVKSGTTAEFHVYANAIINQMKHVNKAKVTLGFWPLSPIDQAYSTDVSLLGFEQGMSAYQSCLKANTKV